MDVTLGGKVGALLRAKGWTQAELAKRANIDASGLSRFMSAKREREPTLLQLMSIARVLEACPWELLKDVTVSEPLRALADAFQAVERRAVQAETALTASAPALEEWRQLKMENAALRCVAADDQWKLKQARRRIAVLEPPAEQQLEQGKPHPSVFLPNIAPRVDYSRIVGFDYALPGLSILEQLRETQQRILRGLRHDS